jgi:hypothetical protein
MGWLESLETPINLGTHFANAARLEALSVTAFRQLRTAVARHGAPRRIRAALSRAARDEVRHARSTAALARRFGGALRSDQRRVPSQTFTLEAIAVDNAAEGCVRETFGALVASYQANHANDLHVRAAMHRIARDETRHAATSWQLHRWLGRRLDARSRNRVDEAMRKAAEQLFAELAVPPPRDAAKRAGLPSPQDARRLFEECRAALWT